MSSSVIDPLTWDDEWFGELSDREMLIWIGVFSRIRDDQGRFVENAALVRARLFPYRDVPVKDIADAFDRFVADDRLHRYKANGQSLLQIVNWWKHQRLRWAAASKLPAPDGWIDRVRTREDGTYVSVNWESCGGFIQEPHTNPSYEPFVLAHEPEPEPDPEPDPKPIKSVKNSLCAEKAPAQPRKVVKAATEADLQARADELLADSHFPSDLLQLAQILADENKTKRVAIGRVVRELYEPIVALQAEVSDAALRHGLRAAIAAGAPNANYVAKAARKYRPIPPGSPVSVELTGSDYDELVTPA